MVRNHSDELRLIGSDLDVIEEANASSSHQSIESVTPCSIDWRQNTERLIFNGTNHVDLELSQ